MRELRADFGRVHRPDVGSRARYRLFKRQVDRRGAGYDGYRPIRSRGSLPCSSGSLFTAWWRQLRRQDLG